MRFSKMILRIVFLLGIAHVQAMQKETVAPKLLREIFVTDGQIKTFLKKQCGLDISTQWDSFLEKNGYLDGETNEKKIAELFKDEKIDPEFESFLDDLNKKIKSAFEKIRRYNENNYYLYRHGIKSQFLQLFDWFSLDEEKKIEFKCYNLVERCAQELPKSGVSPKTFYSASASLLDKHPLDRRRNLNVPIDKIDYQLFLYGASCTTSKESLEEEEWDKGNSFISVVEELILFHFSSDYFLRRLQKNDVSYLSEPLCGFILKEYDVLISKTSKISIAKRPVTEDDVILPKLFEDYKPEGSKTLQGLGFLGLMLGGQITGPEAQRIAQTRYKYIVQKQDIAQDKIVLGTFDVPWCKSSYHGYTCQGDLSARDDHGTRVLDVTCVCNSPVLMLSDGQEMCKQVPSPKIVFIPDHQGVNASITIKNFNSQQSRKPSRPSSVIDTVFVSNEQGGNATTLVYKEGEDICFIEQLEANPLVMNIKENQFHDFDVPSMCTGSLDSKNKLSMQCIEKPYREEVIEKDNPLLDEDYFEPYDARSQSYQQHIADVTRLVVAPHKISVCFIGNTCPVHDRGYTLHGFDDNEQCFEGVKECVKNDTPSETWTVFVKDAQQYNDLNYQDIIWKHGQGTDVLITQDNGPIIIRNGERAYSFLDNCGNCMQNEETQDYVVRMRKNSQFVKLINLDKKHNQEDGCQYVQNVQTFNNGLCHQNDVYEYIQHDKDDVYDDFTIMTCKMKPSGNNKNIEDSIIKKN